MFDVAIVGAGPAGSTLAALLARDGYSVLLLEKHDFPRDKICGDLVSAHAIDLLHDLDCYGGLEERQYIPIQEAAVYQSGAFLLKSPLPVVPEYRARHGRAIPRVELDEAIFRSAISSGATDVQGVTVNGFHAEKNLVRISAQDEKQRQRFLARLIVGADGANSIVARQVGQEMKDARHVQLAMRSYCYGLTIDHAILYFSEEFFPGYGWVMPVRNGLANVGVGMVKESVKKGGIGLKHFYDSFTNFLRHLGSERGDTIEFGPVAGWPIKAFGGTRSNVFDRGLLIGEAGCFVDPLSGEGIRPGLETAELAATTIRHAFARNAFDSRSLMEYEKRWRTHFQPDLSIGDLIVSAARNSHLSKFWMSWMRAVSQTAEQDPDYALKVGGILSGLVRTREALSLGVISKSVLHGPMFWLRAFRPAFASRRARLFSAGELAPVYQSWIADAPWMQDWCVEMGLKQMNVARQVLGQTPSG